MPIIFISNTIANITRDLLLHATYYYTERDRSDRKPNITQA